jgi:diguanylate cyclase (GGDEF)-like protein/PAS domain S-box-containing protein
VPPDDEGPRRALPDPLGNLPDAVYHLDRQWRFTFVNPAFETFVGRGAHELLGRELLECFPALRATSVEQTYAAVLADGRARSFDYLHEPWDRWFELRVCPDSSGLTVFIRDIDDRQRAGERQQAELAQLTAVLETLPAATVLVDDDGRILSANLAWTVNGEVLRASGIEPGAVGDDYLAAMARGLAPGDHAAIAAGLRRLTEAPDGAGTTFEHVYSSPLGSRPAWFRLQAARVTSSRRVVVSHTEETERVRSQQALEWQARHDDLTELPNRTAMLGLVDEALADEVAAGPALLVLDIDSFKTINDSLGHEIGDELLRQVAARLVDQVRPGDAVGRLGGDQFLVLARDCDAAEAASLAFRLQKSFGQPFRAEGIAVPLSVCVGVAVAASGPGPGAAHDLLSDADAAMYAAKATGPDRVHLFSPTLREASRWRLEVATRLRDGAIDQLVVHYQPLVHLGTGAVEGVEALVRWQHPERGLLMPDAFLSVAEETGQVIPITRWLLQETTRRAAQWADDGLELQMSVNISARHFSAESLVRDVRSALRDSGLPAEQLVLELTETSIAEDPTRAEDQLAVLRAHGVRVAIDDFGTGWSSLARLFALPIGTLKIDRSLLTAAERAAGESGAVLTSIVGLTRTLGIRSVAEGVETAEHLRMVRAAGCDLAQGWLLGQPMPAEQVPGFVRRVLAAGGDLCALVEQECAAG